MGHTEYFLQREYKEGMGLLFSNDFIQDGKKYILTLNIYSTGNKNVPFSPIKKFLKTFFNVISSLSQNLLSFDESNMLCF